MTNHSETVKNKSRSQTIYEYLESLQIEYIVADLRCKIYNRNVDKMYWGGIKELKKQKINEISNRNLLPNIFNNGDSLVAIQEKVYVGLSYPNFFYNVNDKYIEQRKNWDLLSYFREGSEVRFSHYDNIEIGYIKKFELGSETAIVTQRGTITEIEVLISKITRIL